MEKNATTALFSLIQADVQKRPDQRLSYWILFCRNIALNLGSLENKQAAAGRTDNTEDAVDEFAESFEDDNEEVMASPNNSKTKIEDHSFQFSTKLTNYQSLVSMMREYSGEDVPQFEVCRIQIKSIAIKCVIMALTSIELDPIHFDLGKSRNKTNEIISNLGSDTNLNAFTSLPKYLSLFLNDLINLACATATYTINDKPILYLQEESMKLIKIVVKMFSQTNDPDINQVDGLKPDRLLSQFISQIVGAVRLGLSTNQSNELYLTTGLVVCDLIKFGFLVDKVVARRLIKSLLAFCEFDKSEETNQKCSLNQLKRLLKTSSHTSEEASTCYHIFGATIAARLLILASNNDIECSLANDTVNAAIISIIDENKEILSSVWMSIAIDSIRISQSDLFYEKNLSNLSDLEISSIILDAKNTDNHPIRGGFTFSSTTNLARLKAHFDLALPFIVVAYSLKSMTKSDTSNIFSLSCILLKRLFGDLLSENMSNKSETVKTISMVLRNLANLISTRIFCEESNMFISQWDNLSSFLIDNVKSAASQIDSIDFSIIFIAIFDLIVTIFFCFLF